MEERALPEIQSDTCNQSVFVKIFARKDTDNVAVGVIQYWSVAAMTTMTTTTTTMSMLL